MATLAPTAPETESGAGAPAVRLSGIRRVYGDVVAVAGIDLDIGAGEFFTMLGPSGSGKTTTLRVIAGFERPDAAKATTAAAFEKGLLLLSCGLDGNVIRLLSPLTASDEELERGLVLLEEALGDAGA